MGSSNVRHYLDAAMPNRLPSTTTRKQSSGPIIHSQMTSRALAARITLDPAGHKV
jgi:hypothetical protein